MYFSYLCFYFYLHFLGTLDLLKLGMYKGFSASFDSRNCLLKSFMAFAFFNCLNCGNFVDFEELRRILTKMVRK